MQPFFSTIEAHLDLKLGGTILYTEFFSNNAITMSDILPNIIDTSIFQEFSKTSEIDIKQYFEIQNFPKEGKRDACRSLTFPTLPLE